MAQSEINTFSAAVDDCVGRSGRIDRKADIMSYLRLTLRETQVLAYFFRDLVEDEITGVTSDPYTWPIPNYFRIMEAVQYPYLLDSRGNVIFAKPLTVNKRMQEEDYYYYGSGNSIVFVGHGLQSGVSVTINVAYFTYFAPLAYFSTTDNRPARYLIDDETGAEGWEYTDAYSGSDALNEAAQALVTNWLLERWYQVMVEGALAKLYKTVGDDRQTSTYALYKQLQTTILSSEQRLAIAGAKT